MGYSMAEKVKFIESIGGALAGNKVYLAKI